MQVKLISKVIIATAALVNAPVSFAGFATYSTEWPDDKCIVNEKLSDHQKKQTAQEDNFLVVTPEEQAQRIDQYKRLYGKFGLTFLSADLRSIDNISYPALSSGVVVNTSASENYVSWEIGLGTRLQYVRLELEYLYEKNIPYNPSPLFDSGETLTSKFTSQSVWFNMMYDMDKLNVPYFTPYVGALVGVVWNKTRSTLSGTIGNGAAENHSRYVLGWGVTIGARMPFWTRWFGYLAYKYLDHGKVVWQDSTGIMRLKGHYVLQGVEVGVQYLLG